ncbi:homing endonuclease associated repeat-containing protein [Halomarina halobia]|uniref:Homing endonuclease associated repeat-containing protein n=2 Tax=Halomarina halobia TaxID=3033386 RepID=A0ABD6AFR5_9EURY
MNEYGQYSRKAASKHFGSWNNALRSSGFEPNHEKIPREELLEEIHRLAENLGRAPFISDLKSDGRYSLRGYIRKFGSWNEAITTAGYEPFTLFTGPDHPLWAGAEKRERLWYGPNWKTTRKRALERDSYECYIQDVKSPVKLIEISSAIACTCITSSHHARFRMMMERSTTNEQICSKTS